MSDSVGCDVRTMSDQTLGKDSTPQSKPLELDGRTLEGGGQLLRLAIGISALTNTPIRINNIRGNRSAGGGLKAQHLACVKWLAFASNAIVSGAEKGSKTLEFQPGSVGSASPAYSLIEPKQGRGSFWECKLDIKSVGSTGLALQAILPFILFMPPRNQDGSISNLPVRLTISGGTNVSGSPSYEYIEQVLLPTLSRIGILGVSAQLNKRGWSHGGSSIGSFTLEIPARKTVSLPAFELYPEDLMSRPAFPARIDATFIGPAATHAHMRDTLLSAINSHFQVDFSDDNGDFSLTCEDSEHEKRYYLLLVATVPSATARPANPSSYKLATDWLYDRRVRVPELATTELADCVSRDLHAEWSSGAYVDEHMRDQLVVFQALAEKGSRTFGGLAGDGNLRDPSLHTQTAEWVCKLLLG